MTSVRGRGRPRQERPSVAPSVLSSVALSIAFSDSSLSPESGNKLFDQLARPSRAKPLTNSPLATSNVPKYSKNDLQRILKTVLENRALVPVPTLVPASAPAPAPVLAPVVSEVPQEKLKAHFPDVYSGKSHMDCYNFCQ